MPRPLSLRTDFDAARLRALARKTKDGPQARRLLALAAIYDGGTRAEAAEIGGVTPQVVRDWVVRFNAHGLDGLLDRKAPGRPARLKDAHRAALAAMVESGPTPATHGVVRWRLVDLCRWSFEEHCVAASKQTLSRELRAMRHRKLSARPRHHAQAEGAIEDFKKAIIYFANHPLDVGPCWPPARNLNTRAWGWFAKYIIAFKKPSRPAWTRSRARRAWIPPPWRSGSATKPESARRTS